MCTVTHDLAARAQEAFNALDATDIEIHGSGWDDMRDTHVLTASAMVSGERLQRKFCDTAPCDDPSHG